MAGAWVGQIEFVELNAALAGRDRDTAVACWLVVFDQVRIFPAVLFGIDWFEGFDQETRPAGFALEIVVAVIADVSISSPHSGSLELTTQNPVWYNYSFSDNHANG